jgi:multiple sugar transport system permease protein
VLSVLFMLPAASILLLFLTYPLGLGIWMGFTDARIGRPGVFIGWRTTSRLFDDDVFWLSVFNTIVYTWRRRSASSASGCGWRCCSTTPCRSRPSSAPSCCSPHRADGALGHRFWWIYDPQFSIVSWSLAQWG